MNRSMRVKIFEGRNIEELEQKINNWFSTSPYANNIMVNDIKYVGTNNSETLGGVFATNNFNYSAMIVYSVEVN